MLTRPGASACVLLSVLGFACHDSISHERDADQDDPAADAALDEPDAAEGDPTWQEPEDAALPDAEEVLDAADAADDAGALVDATLDSGSDRASIVPGQSFETALRIEPGDVASLVDERSVDQVDYFVFHAEAGKFYELTTDRSTFSPDNVISLYDAQHQLLAYNDDGPIWAGDALDARLIVHVAKTGDYFLKVEDPYTEAEFFGSQFSLLYYYLKVRQVSGETPGFARVQTDGCGEPTLRHDPRSGYDYLTLLGLFGAQASACSFAGMAERALIAHINIGGVQHDGSSFQGGQVRVAHADGGVVAEIDRGRGQENIHPPVADGRYAVHVDGAGAMLGDNPYYSIDLVLLRENPAERAEDANNLLAGAEPVAVVGIPGRRGLVLARLPQGDVDYYSFELAAGDTVRAGCEAESAGSGVRGLTAEIRNDADEKLASASETSVENLSIEPVRVPSAGTYHLRLSAAVGGPPSIEPWARCVLLVNR